MSRGEEKWMIGRKGDRWRENYSHAYRGYPVRVKVRKIYDKYGMFSILIYRMEKRLCTARVSVWDGQAEKSFDLSRKEKKQIVFIHMM